QRSQVVAIVFGVDAESVAPRRRPAASAPGRPAGGSPGTPALWRVTAQAGRGRAVPAHHYLGQGLPDLPVGAPDGRVPDGHEIIRPAQVGALIDVHRHLLPARAHTRGG